MYVFIHVHIHVYVYVCMSDAHKLPVKNRKYFLPPFNRSGHEIQSSNSKPESHSALDFLHCILSTTSQSLLLALIFQYQLLRN